MRIVPFLARMESYARPYAASYLPRKLVVSQYSKSRLWFLKRLSKEKPPEPYVPPEDLERTLWGIKFRAPLFNAAGMFKNGESYDVVAAQGAGAYLGGTGTYNPRIGNEKNGIRLPFAPYPLSGSASNWLGIPNDGDEINSERARKIVGRKVDGCPVGWSVMPSPDLQPKEKLKRLVDSAFLYENAGVYFLEINESCPNTGEGKPQYNELASRLRYLKENFLDQRSRRLPVIPKFSNDTDTSQVGDLVDLLIELDFDGVNFGNTSTQYSRRREMIDERERHLYDYFTTDKAFGVGGGVSGRPLKQSSLSLCRRAVNHLDHVKPSKEFHVIRTGGIEGWHDITASNPSSINPSNYFVELHQWFSGYFENFAQHGHGLYKHVFEELTH